jgi:signal transduction histidine kinase
MEYVVQTALERVLALGNVFRRCICVGLLMTTIGIVATPALAADQARFEPLWDAPSGPAQSLQAQQWLEDLRQTIDNAPAYCPPVTMPPIEADGKTRAFSLTSGANGDDRNMVYLQDPVASTFVVVSRDLQGCPAIYVGGRKHAISQREYLSPFPNTRIALSAIGGEVQVVVQDERVMRPWLCIESETGFRRHNLIVWVVLSSFCAVLVMVIVMMKTFVKRTRSVDSYVFYVAAFLWWVVDNFGLNAVWLPQLFTPQAFVYLHCFTVAAVILAIGWTMIEFLALKGLARNLIGLGQLLSAGAFIAAIWWPPGYRWGSLILGLNALPTIALLVRMLRGSDLPIRLFVVGYGATMVGGATQSLSVVFSGAHMGDIAAYSYTLGGFVQVLCWLAAIIFRIQGERAQETRWRKEELERQVAQATTQLIQEKQVAVEAVRAKSDFLAAASHDLRQPTHALGMLIARLGHFPMDPAMRQVQRSLEASAHAMQDLLDELMDYSSLDAGTQRAAPQPVDLNTLLTTLTGTLTPLAAQKGLRLRIRPTSAWVLSDPVILQRMVLNLALNAIRYTEQGTVLIAVRNTATAGVVKIEVRDSGIGIAAKHHQSIFKEFYQVGNAARDRQKGIGLGLSIVQRSAQLLGHEIALHSRLGFGSRFAIILPQTAPLETSAPPIDNETTEETGSIAGLRVLLVEDDDLSRNAVRGLLESWGCKVHAVGTGILARHAMALGPPPDLILSDYRLSETEDGVRLVTELRDIAGHPIPACLISGDMESALLGQIEDKDLKLLHKPVRPAKLRSMIRRLVVS